MDNFALRRTDAARFLAQTQMGWFGLLESRTEGMSATELVERHLYWSAAVRKAASFSERGLPPPALNYREHGEDHLCSETDRSGGRFVRGKLIRERSTEHGTKSDLTRHQHQEGDQAHQLSSRNRSSRIDPIHAPAADEPTRGEHYRRFDDDGGRLTQARGEQKDANGAENKAD
jgi:hypothetical protein